MSPRRPGSELPSGTLTFLFTDIAGSTRLLQALGPDRWQAVLGAHNRVMRRAIEKAGGTEVGTEGDAFFAVFPIASTAVAAAVAAQRGLAQAEWPEEGPVRVRMGMHTGEGIVGGDDYVGLDVHRAARIAAVGHGGQVLLSEATRTLVESSLGGDIELRDLGQHRLKDLDRPIHLHQVVLPDLPSDFPPIRSLEPPTNLPGELTSLVGRDREVDRIEGLLSRNRLVTLTGPGGAGKTTLALEVGRRLLGDLPDGVFLVELAALADPKLVPRAVAEVLGVREEGPRPILELVASELRDRATLLIIDNFEQLLAAAPTVSNLLAAAPKLRMLVTSRAPLRIRGEQRLPVPPLETPEAEEAPDPERLPRYPSVQLFLERAQAVDPSFSLTRESAAAVAGICSRLDGLPLAIELAASRVGILTPADLLARLDRSLPVLTSGPRDAPARQRTLEGAIAWSYDLLEEEGRVLFRRLAAFAGGWTTEAAEAVVPSDAGPSVDMIDALDTLVGQSLVQRKPAGAGFRFDMLWTIRDFAVERLEAEEDPRAVRERHARYFLAMAESAQPHLRGAEQGDRLAELEREHDNLRAALAWAIGADEGEVALRLVGALWRFWHLHGHLVEGRRWSGEALALPSAQGRTAFRVNALSAEGGLAYWQNDAAGVRAAYEEAMSIAREIGDPPAVAEAVYNLAFARGMAGEGMEARSLFEEARGLFEEIGDARAAADTLTMLSVMARLQGDLDDARGKAEESLRVHRELHDGFGTLDALYVLGRAAYEMGDLETARSTFLEAFEANLRTGNRTGIVICLDNLAAQELGQERFQRAVTLAGASDAVKETAGGQGPQSLMALPDAREAARESLPQAEIAGAWDRGRSMTPREAMEYALGADDR